MGHPRLTTKPKDLWTEFQSALAGAQQGNWRDLKTVFEFAGIYPAKEKAEARS